MQRRNLPANLAVTAAAVAGFRIPASGAEPGEATLGEALVAAALGQLGRRDDCIRALLTAEHHAPEETHARPAVRSLVSGLLASGRTTSALRGLAARSGILT
ncbi:hypothetical protein ACWDR1_29205 [Streptosporangium sandarakinum]